MSVCLGGRSLTTRIEFMIGKIHLPAAIHGVAQGSLWITVGQSALLTVYDLRYLLMLTAVLIIADCWWAYRENKAHSEDARVNHTAPPREWRPSQAIRRSAIKFCDYLSCMIVGDIIGKAIVDPITGGHYVMLVAIIAVCIPAAAELLSLFGHMVYVETQYQLKLREVPKAIWLIIRGAGVEIAKMKAPEVGEALEKSLNDYDNKNEKKTKERKCEQANE